MPARRRQPTTVRGFPHQERGPLGKLPRRLAHLVAMIGARLVGGKQAVPDLPEAASGKVSGICPSMPEPANNPRRQPDPVDRLRRAWPAICGPGKGQRAAADGLWR
jgi:hypothetical protein